MERLTEIRGGTVYYTGQHSKLPGLDCASTMLVAAVRDVMQRLAEYEATGLEPDEIRRLAAPVNIHQSSIFRSETVAALHQMGAKVHSGRAEYGTE